MIRALRVLRLPAYSRPYHATSTTASMHPARRRTEPRPRSLVQHGETRQIRANAPTESEGHVGRGR